jgi:2-dehydropantoate 2-reductase
MEIGRMNQNTVVIWGAGAIGGTVGAHLVRAGSDVLFVDRAEEHVAAMARNGLAITGPVAAFKVKANAVTPERAEGPLGTVLLCVKAQDTEGAARAIAPNLSPEGCIVSVQNGLNELVISEIAGAARTVGAFVNFGADYMEPGVRRTPTSSCWWARSTAASRRARRRCTGCCCNLTMARY